jgi:pimeloyl-ACP methyl ester carboxylesterase
VTEPRALLQIKGSIGWLPVPRDFTEGGEILRRLFAARFRKLTAQDWIALARRTWREDGRALAPDYDIRLIRRLQGNLEQPPPTLWDAFDALADVPAMIIRGANSAMLTSSTVDSMLARRRELNIVVVPDQGHAPLLEDTSLIGRIAAFTASCDLAQGDRRRPCELLDQHSHGGLAVQPHPRP